MVWFRRSVLMVLLEFNHLMDLLDHVSDRFHRPVRFPAKILELPFDPEVGHV